MRYFALLTLLTLAGTAALPAAEPTGKMENRLVRQIGHELVMLPYYGVFDQLSYKVEGSTVTLLGQVTRPTLKSSAENVVKDVEGVETINNQIEVLPLSAQDDRIRLALYQAIYGHATLNRYAIRAVPSIHIIVKNGNVRLTGAVATELDRNVAEMQARQVPGTFQVTNDLQISKD